MPVDTERKTKPYHLVVGCADITLYLSQDLADEDLQEIFEAFKKVSLFNRLRATPVTPPGVPFGPPSTGEVTGGDAKTRPGMADEMWERGASARPSEGGPHQRTEDAFVFDSPPEFVFDSPPEEAQKEEPPAEPTLDIAKIARETGLKFLDSLKKALEDL